MVMAAFVQSRGVTSTGSDVTPDALNWTNVSATSSGSNATGTTNTLAIAGIDTPITLRASWTTAGSPNTGTWVKNGVPGSFGTSPQEVTVNLADTLAFRLRLLSLDSDFSGGTVTVINRSDSDAPIDTFTYSLEII